MAAIGIKTTTDYLNWNTCIDISKELLKSTNRTKKRIGLYILTQMYTGLRYLDTIKLTRKDLLKSEIWIKEQKTGKEKKLAIHPDLRTIIEKHTNKDNEQLFLSNKGTLISSPFISIKLKEYLQPEFKDKQISTHSLRKTFGRRFFEMNGRSDNALIHLQMIFNHATSKQTRDYLGITFDEIKAMQFNM